MTIQISLPHPLFHPARVSLLAVLHGLPFQIPSSSRILEIGCGTGGTILAFAAQHPDAACVGVDSSNELRELAKKRADEMGLKNVRFIKDEEISGEFDYVYCNGILSGLTQENQIDLLSRLKRHTKQSGYVYLNHKVLPGGCDEQATRVLSTLGMLKMKSEAEGTTRLKEALDFLSSTSKESRPLFSEYLRACAKALPNFPSGPIWPTYFYEFVSMVRSSKMQFLGDLDFSTMVMDLYPDEVVQAANAFSSGNFVLTQQFLDFYSQRNTRHSVLCSDDSIALRKIEPDRMMNAHVLLNFSVKLDPENIESQGDLKIQMGGRTMTLTDSSEWVRPVLQSLESSRAETIRATDLKLQVGKAQSKDLQSSQLARLLLKLYSYGMVLLLPEKGSTTMNIADRPVAYSFARQVSKLGPIVSNPYFHSIGLSDLQRSVLQMLDGTKTPKEIGTSLNIDKVEVCVTELAQLGLLMKI